MDSGTCSRATGARCWPRRRPRMGLLRANAASGTKHLPGLPNPFGPGVHGAVKKQKKKKKINGSSPTSSEKATLSGPLAAQAIKARDSLPEFSDKRPYSRFMSFEPAPGGAPRIRTQSELLTLDGVAEACGFTDPVNVAGFIALPRYHLDSPDRRGGGNLRSAGWADGGQMRLTSRSEVHVPQVNQLPSDQPPAGACRDSASF